jgi:Domain of unknown function (DUF4760)
MSLELVNTLATFGTFVVIAATAIAAIVQLRHARSSNQIAALNEFREMMETADFQAAQHFVMGELPKRLPDPAFRYQTDAPAARTDENRPLITKINSVGNFYEGMGMLIRAGLVDQSLVVEMWGSNVIGAWERLAPVTAIARRKSGERVWEKFEYLTVLAQDWQAAHPKGTYPANVRRIELKDEWLDADKQYAASLAPA